MTTSTKYYVINKVRRFSNKQIIFTSCARVYMIRPTVDLAHSSLYSWNIGTIEYVSLRMAYHLISRWNW